MPLPPALEKVVGKPWTSWVALAGSSLPSDLPATKRNGEIVSSGRKNHLSSAHNDDPATHTHSRRLNRSEMAIFGNCPLAERLTLIPCSYCGDKFKYAALAEHIRLRHGGVKKPSTKLGSPDKKKSPTQLRVKGRFTRLTKEKDAPLESSVSDEGSDKSQEWPKTVSESAETHHDGREIAMNSVLLQFMLKQQNGGESKDSKSNKDIKAKLRKPKLPEPSLPIIVDSVHSLDKSPSSHKRESKDSIADLSPLRGKEKLKSESSPKKAKLDQSVKTSTIDEVKPKLEKFEDDEVPLEEPPELVQEAKTPEPKKKKGQKTSTVKGGRVYDPDIHCGVVSKENARPCTRSLICKLHSLTLRKAVRGRTKPFDVLVTAHHKEKEIEKGKVLGAEMVSPLANQPSSIKVSANLVELDVKPISPKVEPKPSPSNDVGKLSIPVSIQNPNLWSQLQAPSAEPTSLPLSEEVRRLEKNFLLKKTVKSALFQKMIKNDKAKDTLKHSVPNSSCFNGERREFPIEGFVLPGYKRSGSLLTTSYGVSRMAFSRKCRLHPSREPCDKIGQQGSYLLYLNSDIKDTLPDVYKGNHVADTEKKNYNLLKLPDQNVLSSMPSVAAQVIPPRVSNSEATEGSSRLVTKPLNLFGPINGKTVMPLTLVSTVKNSSDVSSDRFDGCSSSTESVGLLHGDIVRLKPPRTHFFTPSGPLSLGVNPPPNNQLACKQLHPKPQFLPNSSLTASGIVYLQRTVKTAY